VSKARIPSVELKHFVTATGAHVSPCVKGQNSERGIETASARNDVHLVNPGVKGQNSERGIETGTLNALWAGDLTGVKGQNSERGIETQPGHAARSGCHRCQRPEFRAWN